MHRLGIQRPKDEIILPEKSKVSYWEPKDERKKRGKSTLHPWICPECGQKLRATSKGDIASTHDACGVKYIRAGEVDRTIYKSIMRDKNEKIIGIREKDDAPLNFVNYQAQEAILNPTLPES
jgi:hypothetical protein